MTRLDDIRARLAAVAAWGPFDCLAHPGVRHCGVCYPCVAAGVARDALAEVERLTGERAADAKDAARWRSLWACERIRFVGGASLGTPDALFGADFHRKHPARDDAQSRALLLDFVDGTGLGMACFSEVPDADVASEGPAKGAGSSMPRLCAVCWGDGCERCCQTGVEGTP